MQSYGCWQRLASKGTMHFHSMRKFDLKLQATSRLVLGPAPLTLEHLPDLELFGFLSDDD
jgi:hypothetical protein